jgi:hypothetical protein
MDNTVRRFSLAVLTNNRHHAVIKLAREEREIEISKGPVHRIAHDIYEYADETVGHAEGVSREELMLECYHKLGSLLAQWAKKLDKIEPVHVQPSWLREYIDEENAKGHPMVDLGPESLGFEIDHLFFAKEKKEAQLSDDLLMVSQPNSMWMEDFKQLVRFCDNLGLDFYVDGFNTTLPGRTFRVVIYKSKDGPHTRLEFRENSLLGMQLFESLKREGKAGMPSKQSLVDSLLDSGKFEDRKPAEKLVDFLVASRLIPRLA